MKLTNLYLTYQTECPKALCFPIACVSHYPIYHSLLGEFTHSWSMLAVYLHVNMETPLTAVQAALC